MTEVSIERTFSQGDFDAFAVLSGDDNPIHVDPAYAARTRFGRTVAHGVMLCSILRDLAGRLVPGARQAAQEITFPAPTYADESMRFSARIESRVGGLARVAVEARRVTDGATTCVGWMEFAS